MKEEIKITEYHLRKFSPINRETPIFEVLFKEKILMDISKNESTGKYEIMFYQEVSGKYVEVDMLNDIIEKAKNLFEGE